MENKPSIDVETLLEQLSEMERELVKRASEIRGDRPLISRALEDESIGVWKARMLVRKLASAT